MKSGLSEDEYSILSRRYSRIGLNCNNQDCYEENEIALIKKILTEYEALAEGLKRENYFSLIEEKQWRELWTCHRPALNSRFETGVFTLPTRESKDTSTHPLYEYAVHVAKQIANLQDMRVKNQVRIMNDPVMLVLEELKDWFFQIVAEKECKIEVLNSITKRQSYIKRLIHLIPNFGPDRSFLHEIQLSMDGAVNKILQCVATKELPHLLSDVIIGAKSLEDLIGTYAHFLSIGQQVSGNFLSQYLEGEKKNCKYSPVCKIYHAANSDRLSQASAKSVSIYRHSNRFYELTEQNTLKLKTHLSRVIDFADFMTEESKSNYVEIIATLEGLIHVRKAIEKFQTILPKMGTYLFAVNYLESFALLSKNYVELVGKVKALTKNLIRSVDEGLNDLLKYPDQQTEKNLFFEKNLRSLESRAKETTIHAQLEDYSQQAVRGIDKFKNEIGKLAAQVESGDASKELESLMRDVFSHVSDLNYMIPAMLGKPLTHEEPLLVAEEEMEDEDNQPVAQEFCPHLESNEAPKVNFIQTQATYSITDWTTASQYTFNSLDNGCNAREFKQISDANVSQSDSNIFSYSGWLLLAVLLYWLKNYLPFTFLWNKEQKTDRVKDTVTFFAEKKRNKTPSSELDASRQNRL